jgi:protein-disulfide isomerase
VNRSRLILLAGAIAAAAVVVVVVILVAGGGSDSPAATTTTAQTQTGGSGEDEAVSTFEGVPQRGDTLGKASAPVTLVVFEDPQCPYCKQWNLDTLPTVVRDYVRTGRIKIQYHGIVVIGPNSVAGLRAEYAAGRQNKLWNMVEALYERQGEENSGWITIPVIRAAARDAGASPSKVIADADSKAVTSQLNASAALAQSYGVAGTPTFALQRQLGPLEQLQVSGLDPDQFTPALDAALQ